MIRQTLAHTKAATFSVEVPRSAQANMPKPSGTGFFISADGLFVTARHVLAQGKDPSAPLSAGLTIWLRQPAPAQPHPVPPKLYGRVAVLDEDATCDFALLKADLTETAPSGTQPTGVPHLEVSLRPLDEGEPVYSFGYPLPQSDIIQDGPILKARVQYSPRTTSAVVSSSVDVFEDGAAQPDCRHYVMDKALNYGNSGGPILSTATGKVHAFCSRFQPVSIRQPHLGTGVVIQIPSLYGVVTSLASEPIVRLLQKHGVAPSHA